MKMLVLFSIVSAVQSLVVPNSFAAVPGACAAAAGTRSSNLDPLTNPLSPVRESFPRLRGKVDPESLKPFPAIEKERERAMRILGEGTPEFEKAKKLIDDLKVQEAPAAIKLNIGRVFQENGAVYWETRTGKKVLIRSKQFMGPKVLTNVVPSPDGKYLAFATEVPGTAVKDFHIVKLDPNKSEPLMLTKNPLQVYIEGFSWSHDSKSVFYSRHSDVTQTHPNGDALPLINPAKPVVEVIEVSLPKERGAKASENVIFTPPILQPGNYGIHHIKVPQGDNRKMIVAHKINDAFGGTDYPLDALKGTLNPDGKTYTWDYIFKANQDVGHFVGQAGDNLIFRTNIGKDANTFGLTSVSIRDGSKRPYVEPRTDLILDRTHIVQGRLILYYWNPKNQHWSIEIRDANTLAVEKIFSPEELAQADGKRLEPDGTFKTFVAGDGSKIYANYSSMKNPSTTIEYDLSTKETKVLERVKGTTADLSVIKKEIITVKSADGFDVMMTLFYRKDMKEAKAVSLFGYGNIGLLAADHYEPGAVAAVLDGQVWANIHVRGGAEYGARGYVDGALNLKHDQDYYAGAEALYKRFGKRVIGIGRSYEGRGAARRLINRPDLFLGAIPIVPYFTKWIFTNHFTRTLGDDSQPPRDMFGNQLVNDRYLKQLEGMFPDLDKLDPSKKMILITQQFDTIVPGQDSVYPQIDRLRKRCPDANVCIVEHTGGHPSRNYSLALYLATRYIGGFDGGN